MIDCCETESDVCKCECHKVPNFKEHCMECCEVCPHCRQNIQKHLYKKHVEECAKSHPETAAMESFLAKAAPCFGTSQKCPKCNQPLMLMAPQGKQRCISCGAEFPISQ